jgi:hypothetical protein
MPHPPHYALDPGTIPKTCSGEEFWKKVLGSSEIELKLKSYVKVSIKK